MGTLTLVPTPIYDTLPLEPVARRLLEEAALNPRVLLLVEELKVARQRWLSWGLPRESIQRFRTLNEHDREESRRKVLDELRAGKSAVLLSDCGMPAFCDPGQDLVDACHSAGIRVTATPFPNSVALAVALSGFPHQRFYFAGFPPADSTGRKQEFERLARMEETIVLMDTPYRFRATLEDLGKSSLRHRMVFLACHLNAPEERLFRGLIPRLLEETRSLEKPEFVAVIRARDQRPRN
jgi:16S rRNA (cytidine1402-2'-O)-methyltransferase